MKKNQQATGNKPPENGGKPSLKQDSIKGPDTSQEAAIVNKKKSEGNISSLGKEKENPKDGNIGKNNAGGYE